MSVKCTNFKKYIYKMQIKVFAVSIKDILKDGCGYMK